MPSLWLVDVQANPLKRIVPLAWAALAVGLCAWPAARTGARVTTTPASPLSPSAAA